MPEEHQPMDIEQNLFERFPLNDDGDLWVAIYSRRLWAEQLYRSILRGDADAETHEQYHRQCLLLQAGHEEYVSDEDYFYDVLDGFNAIARYDDRDCVVGRRIMSWVEFRASTNRDVSRYESFAQFRMALRAQRDEYALEDVDAPETEELHFETTEDGEIVDA